MAAINASNDDFITCALCLEVYVEPKLLPCYHTYCKMCIQQIIEKNTEQGYFSCPICRAKVSCREGQDLPTNIYIQTQISFKSKELKCDLCDSQNINSRCMDCEQFLCSNCLTFHEKIKSCKEHQVIEYAILSEESDTPKLKVKKNSYCLKHSNEILRFFCIQCKIPVCRDCKHTTHEGHKSEDVEDRVRDATIWIQYYCNRQLQFEISSLNNQRNSMINLKKLLDKSADKVDEIELDLCNKVKQQCSELKLEISKLSEKAENSVEDRKREIESHISRINSESKYLKQTVEYGSDADIIQCKSQILKTFVHNEIGQANHIDLTIPAFLENEEIQLPLPTLGQIRQGQLKMGLTVELKSTFHCNVMNKSVASLCLKSTVNEVVVLFRHDSYNQDLKNAISYTSDGSETACYLMPPQLDFVIGLDMRIYFFKDNLKGKECIITPYLNPGDELPEQENYITCEKPISTNTFQNGDFIVLDTFLKVTRINFSKKEKNVLIRGNRFLTSPLKVACDLKDNIWITDPGAEKIVVFDSKGNFKFKFDAKDHLKLPDKFKPNGICMYNTYLNCALVADPMNNCVFSVSQDGQYCDVILDRRNGLESPTCVACKGEKLWVCDKNNRIRVYEMKI